MSLTLILVLVALALILYGVSIYNKLITLRNQVKNSWSQIDVQLQRRYDLIPNLVETVKGYMQFESETLQGVIAARSQAMSARESIQREGGAPSQESMKQLVGAEQSLTSGLGRIFALAENYPQLRSTENMQQLQEELRSTENKISFARQSYNDQVMEYNNTQEKFPNSFFAGMFGHKPADQFQVDNAEAKKAVKVSFTHKE